MAQKRKSEAYWEKILGKFPKGLKEAAKTAIEKVLRVRKSEGVLIVTNPEKDVLTISAALYDAAATVGADVNIVVQPRRSSLEMASDAVIHALRSRPDVIISTSADKMGKDRFGLETPYRFKGVKGSWPHIFNALMASGQARSFWSPSITLDTFIRTVPVDYAEMSRAAKKLKRSLSAANWVQITAPGGTNLEMGLQDRLAFTDDGAFHKAGTGGNLPAGETYISPANYASEGVIVFDGSLAVADGGSAFIPKKPVRLEITDGLVTKVSGGAGAKRLEKSLVLGEKAAAKMKGTKGWDAAKIDYYRTNARHLGELGIGLNPAAKVTGNMLEDEKILGTCHIAIGTNYDGDADAFIHLDCVIQSPTIHAFNALGRKKLIMDGGKLV